MVISPHFFLVLAHDVDTRVRLVDRIGCRVLEGLTQLIATLARGAIRGVNHIRHLLARRADAAHARVGQNQIVNDEAHVGCRRSLGLLDPKRLGWHAVCP